VLVGRITALEGSGRGCRRSSSLWRLQRRVVVVGLAVGLLLTQGKGFLPSLVSLWYLMNRT